MSKRKLAATATLSLALIVGLGTWVYAQFDQHGVSSASASVGTKIANTSASNNVAEGDLFLAPGVKPTFAATSSVTLMVTDVNNDGKQDIKILLTTPPLFRSTLPPPPLVGTGAKHGVFITDGATGLPLANTVVSQN